MLSASSGNSVIATVDSNVSATSRAIIALSPTVGWEVIHGCAVADRAAIASSGPRARAARPTPSSPELPGLRMSAGREDGKGQVGSQSAPADGGADVNGTCAPAAADGRRTCPRQASTTTKTAMRPHALEKYLMLVLPAAVCWRSAAGDARC